MLSVLRAATEAARIQAPRGRAACIEGNRGPRLTPAASACARRDVVSTETN